MLKRLLNYLIDNYFSSFLSNESYKNRYSILNQPLQMRKDYLDFLEKVKTMDDKRFKIGNNFFEYDQKRENVSMLSGIYKIISYSFLEKKWIINYKKTNNPELLENVLIRLKLSIKSDEDLLKEIKQMRNK